MTEESYDPAVPEVFAALTGVEDTAERDRLARAAVRAVRDHDNVAFATILLADDGRDPLQAILAVGAMGMPVAPLPLVAAWAIQNWANSLVRAAGGAVGNTGDSDDAAR